MKKSLVILFIQLIALNSVEAGTLTEHRKIESRQHSIRILGRAAGVAAVLCAACVKPDALPFTEEARPEIEITPIYELPLDQARQSRDFFDRVAFPKISRGLPIQTDGDGDFYFGRFEMVPDSLGEVVELIGYNSHSDSSQKPMGQFRSVDIGYALSAEALDILTRAQELRDMQQSGDTKELTAEILLLSERAVNFGEVAESFMVATQRSSSTLVQTWRHSLIGTDDHSPTFWRQIINSITVLAEDLPWGSSRTLSRWNARMARYSEENSSVVR